MSSSRRRVPRRDLGRGSRRDFFGTDSVITGYKEVELYDIHEQMEAMNVNDNGDDNYNGDDGDDGDDGFESDVLQPQTESQTKSQPTPTLTQTQTQKQTTALLIATALLRIRNHLEDKHLSAAANLPPPIS